MKTVTRALVGAALVLLGGCTSSDPAPATLPTLGPAGTLAASPLPTGPAPVVTGPPVAVPSGSSAATPVGAEAFARFFYAQVEAAFTRHDATLVRRYSQPTCAACTRWAGQVEVARKASQRVTGVVFEITAATAPVFTGTTVTVRVAYSSPAGHRYDRVGTQVARTPAQPAAVELLGLARERGTWKVASASLH